MGSGPSAVAEGLSGHHPPPFARLLAAQALTEPLRVVPPHNPCWRSIKKGPSRSDVYKKCPIRLECKGQEPTPVTSAADAAKLERFALEACTDCD